MAPDYDCIVVGAGAGGIIVAALVAESGKRVLLVERGGRLSYETDGRRDHLRNQRLSTYGHNAGPDIVGNPRVLVDVAGREHVLAPHQPGYSNNAAAVGGGTVVYGAQAWRFLPDDFRMASRYGVPAGSSLADWPIGYDTLEPFYQQAEWEIGVAGAGDGNRHQGQRARNYPMPPMPQGRKAEVLRRGADRLGIATFTPPLLINTVDRAGRPGCIRCASCVAFPCPVDAKNGTQNTMLPRALATGNCDLLTHTVAAAVETDMSGNIVGVSLIEERDGSTSRRLVTARMVVLSGGAVETARLLLMSRSRLHPDGLGNAHDLVGRNLQGHHYPSAYGAFDEIVYEPQGPGVSIATSDFNHGNDGVIGGAMLADEFIVLPIHFWKSVRPPDVPHWGRAAKAFMRDGYRRILSVKGPVQEIPSPDCRVTLDPAVTDRFGLPVVRLAGVSHAETLRTASFMLGKARQWLEAAGARRVWGIEPKAGLSGGQHQAGTCRMGTEPVNSVTDQWGRVWGHDNLFVADGSLHPTNGGFNPALTIMALAFRNGAYIAEALR